MKLLFMFLRFEFLGGAPLEIVRCFALGQILWSRICDSDLWTCCEQLYENCESNETRWKLEMKLWYWKFYETRGTRQGNFTRILNLLVLLFVGYLLAEKKERHLLFTWIYRWLYRSHRFYRWTQPQVKILLSGDNFQFYRQSSMLTQFYFNTWLLYSPRFLVFTWIYSGCVLIWVLDSCLFWIWFFSIILTSFMNPTVFRGGRPHSLDMMMNGYVEERKRAHGPPNRIYL